MAGIYIHVPFCKKGLPLLQFSFLHFSKSKKDLVLALLREIELTASRINDHPAYLNNEIIDTIYFGGGTPSLLEQEELLQIMSALHQYYQIDAAAEITFEANPDDITPGKLKDWKEAGINRLSIGIQSFVDEHLAWMNRAHSSLQSLTAIDDAMQQGFYNISIDLIYGVPGMSSAQWLLNLEQAGKLQIPHLSCYALTVEPSTALYKMIRQKKRNDVDEEMQSEHFNLLSGWAESAGYEQYEISNFARAGMRSRHNSAYWQGKRYLGLGPSAHSFNGDSRQWNVANNSIYIQSINANKLPVEIEMLSPDQQFNEYIMTSLRTTEGINMEYVASRFGEGSVLHVQNSIKQYSENGTVIYKDNAIQLAASGRFFADGIAAAIFK